VNYDPRDHGADCAACPLNGTPVVPPTFNLSARAILIGEAPDKFDVDAGRPFAGPSGLELNRALKVIGIDRRGLAINNVILCQPPENNFAKLEKQRAKAIKKGLVGKTATEACLPRLLKEIEEHPCTKLITLGGTAFKAISTTDSSITAVRGGPREVVIGSTLKQLLPTLHPKFVTHARRWTRAFQSDLSRAFRWFDTGLGWKDPETILSPRPAELEAWIARHKKPYIVYDLETLPGFPAVGHFDPLHDKITIVGLGNAAGNSACVVQIRTKDGVSRYVGRERDEIVGILTRLFADASIRKAGQNSGYYDRMVVESQLRVTPTPHLDLIGLHKMVEPELPHGLGYMGSVYTDVPSWKDAHTATTYETDEELAKYNAVDLSVTALALDQVSRAVVARDQVAAAKFWPKVQNVCVGLHRNGMRVDQAKRREYDRDLLAEAVRHRKEIRERIERPKFNPNSNPQLQDLLFEEWGLLPTFYTETGDPSTNDDSLRSFLMQPTLPPARKAAIKAIRAYRAAVKLRGTYVTKLAPINEPISVPELAWDEDESPAEREDRIKKDAKKHGICLPDGRIHGNYNGHGTVGWRLSASGPNCQNFPTDIRDMIIPGEGNIFVSCDEAQLELRMVAGLSKAASYCAAFQSGGDPHLDLSRAFFGDVFDRAPKDGKKKLRRLIKEFTFASAYRAGPHTVWEVLTSGEGWVCPECGADLERKTSRCEKHPTTNPIRSLIFPELTIRETTALHETWLERNPEIPTWWETDLASFKRDHFLAEPIFGLKRDFLDGEDPNEIANYRPQSGGSALVHLATMRILDEVPFECWGKGTGIVNQEHDALLIECPIAEGERIQRVMEEAMKEDGNKWGLPVPFVGESKRGMTWRDV
jgi:uracil-DNA glycosylase family 4